MQVRDANRNRRGTVALVAVCVVLQLALAPNIGIADGRMNLCLVAAACYALSIGGRPGVAFGFFIGLFFDLTTTGPVGLMAFELTLISLVLGTEGRNRLADDWQGSLKVFLVAAVACELVYGIAMVMVGAAGSFGQVMLLRTLPSVLLDDLAFFFLGSVARRTGGGSQRSFGAGGNKRRGAQKFSVKGL